MYFELLDYFCNSYALFWKLCLSPYILITSKRQIYSKSIVSVILGFSGVVDSWNYKLYAIKIGFELDVGQFFYVKKINMNNEKCYIFMIYKYHTHVIAH